MVKYVVLISRRRDIALEEFLRHWYDVHLPLLVRLPGLRRCALSPTIKAPGYEPAFDGIGELWFDSVEAALEAFSGPEGRAARADTPTFAEAESVVRFFAQDHGMQWG